MKLYQDIQAVIEKTFPELADSAFEFQTSPENQPGDFGLACFRFAKQMKVSPPQVSEKLATLDYPDIIAGTVTTGPYLNFTLNRVAFASGLIREIFTKQEAFGSTGEGLGKKVLLEHTSINPNASPHIGRSRNGLIGDTLARLLRFQGYDVNVHYYVNDMGKQIGLLTMEIEDPQKLNFNEVLDLYVSANQRAKDDPEFEAKGFELLMKMEDGDPEVRKAFGDIVDICLKGQLDVLSRLGLSYDTFDKESTFLNDPRMDDVVKMLESKGALFTDEKNRQVVDLKQLGYDREEGRYFVLRRGNGSTMYMFRDIAYTLEKIDRGGDMNIIVLGEDHKMYFEQMELVIRAMGKIPPEAVHYSYILLKEGKMSTRQGTVVLLEDFLDEAIRHSRAKVDEQWPDMNDAESADIARIIGIGAVRFAILSIRSNRNVIFDWETALSFTGDTGPYIQYSCTRIASILRKNADKYGDVPESDDIIKSVVISHDAEWNLVKRLALVGADISYALRERNPAIIATTALDVARKFSSFYNECPVLGAENDSFRISRILLCRATHRVLINLLNLLGIEAPSRM